MLTRLIVLLFFTVSLSAMEAEKFPFVGIGVSNQSIDIFDQRDHETTFSLRYGQQTVDWRTTLFYEFHKSEYQSLSIEIDKILRDRLFGTPKIRPYLGLTLGTLKYKEDLLPDTSGYYYGGSAGLILYVTDTIDADISYHHHIIQEIESLDTIKGFSLSFHYFF